MYNCLVMEETLTQKPFAIFTTGGKQYLVKVGDILTVEKLADDLIDGAKITFDKVLLKDDVGDTTVGTPFIKGATVEAEFIENGKGKKISILRFKAKSNFSRKQGHRQPFSKIKIISIK